MPAADDALSYSALGLRVFPCQPGGKMPATENGFKDATTSEQQIHAWFDHGRRNIAIATGHGVMVLDVDRHGVDGEATLAALMSQHGAIPMTWESTTPSGGRHLFFRVSETIRNSAGKVGPGLDIRGDGGYVVASPSTTPDGVYAWSVHPSQCELADCPPWLLALARGKAKPKPKRADKPKRDKVTEGGRNSHVYSRCLPLRRARAGEAAILAHAREVNATECSPPLDDAEVRKIASSLAGAQVSRDYPHSDGGNAERLVDEHGADLLHCHGLGWLRWTGVRWRLCADGHVIELARALARQAMRDAADIDDPAERSAAFRWAQQCDNRGRLEAAAALAASDPRVAVEPADLDSDPWMLGCENGVIDLRTGQLREARREDRITKSTGCDYNPDSRSAVFDAFMVRTTNGDKDFSAYLQRAAGYCSTGSTRDQVLFLGFDDGNGSTGKSTWLRAVSGALGDYARAIPTSVLIRSHNNSGTQTALAELPGVRLATASEAPDGATQFDSEAIKSWTGGDKTPACKKYRDPFVFQPQFKLFLVCNRAPRASALDGAFHRRVRALPFVHVIAAHERDHDLPRKLARDASAVLAWIVAGAVEWYKSGLGTCRAVEQWTVQYREANDPLSKWLEECCVLDENSQSTRAELRGSYEQWSAANGHRFPLGVETFTACLRQRGVTERKTMGNRMWIGIRLATQDDFRAAEGTFSLNSPCEKVIGKVLETGALGCPNSDDDCGEGVWL